MKHEGSCHCGGARVTLESERSAADLPVRGCGCGYCQPRRARYTSDPAGRASVILREGMALDAYRFGTKTADFVRCNGCGMLIGALCTVEGELYAVISAALFVDLRDRSAALADFDGEGVDDRLARRARTWTPITVTGQGEFL